MLNNYKSIYENRDNLADRIKRFPMARKEDRLSNVQSVDNDKFNNLDMSFNIPEYTPEEVWGMNFDPEGDLQKPFVNRDLPQYFLVEFDDGKCLIDTSGYNYARYIVKIPGI